MNTRLTFHESTVVHNASWQPRYDLRLDSISKSGQIVYRAHFSNKTYESWKDAKITFSSSAQTFGGLNEVVPLMAAWNISLGKNRVFGTATDHSDGLYSLKEQSELEKRGVNIAGKKVRYTTLGPAVQSIVLC